MPIGHAGSMASYDLNYPTCPRCKACNKSFIRLKADLRTLADGRVIDPNEYCPTCENSMAAAAVVAKREETLGPWKQSGFTREDYERMDMECLRKIAFETHARADKVAKQSRFRHKGKTPCIAYRCTCPIDPVLYPERAKTHYHIGGNTTRPKL